MGFQMNQILTTRLFDKEKDKNISIVVLCKKHCCSKSKVKWLARKPVAESTDSTLKKLVSEWTYLGNQYYTQGLDVLNHGHLQTYNHVMKSRNNWSMEWGPMFITAYLAMYSLKTGVDRVFNFSFDLPHKHYRLLLLRSELVDCDTLYSALIYGIIPMSQSV